MIYAPNPSSGLDEPFSVVHNVCRGQFFINFGRLRVDLVDHGRSSWQSIFAWTNRAQLDVDSIGTTRVRRIHSTLSRLFEQCR